MGTMVEFNATKIDQLGLTEDISEGELDALAGQIGEIEELLPMVKGDMYLKKCVYLGINPFAHVADMKSGRASAFLKLAEFCAKLNNAIDSLQSYARVSRDWPRNERIAGLSTHHYRVVSGLRSDNKAEAVRILQEAQIGHQKPDGAWIKPHSSRWVARQVRIWKGDAKATIGAAVDDSHDEVVTSVIPEVSKTLKTIKVGGKPLPAAKIAVIENKIEKAISKETKKLKEEFSAAVDTQVDTMLANEKAEVRKIRSDAAADAIWNRRMRDGIKTTITEQEFKMLRQFCHPDKNPGREDQARKVYDVAVKIGEKLGFV